MSSTSQLSFLDLPQSIRLHVFELAGLVRPGPILLCVENKEAAQHGISSKRRKVKKSDYASKTSRVSLRIDLTIAELPVALLRVCRSIYTEAIPLLYGNNKFRLRARSCSDLAILRTLAPYAIVSLKFLLIHLNCSLLGHEGFDRPSGVCRFCGDRVISLETPVKADTSVGQDILKEWEAVCACLAQSVRSTQLALTVISDTTDLRIDRALVEALSMLPRLRECTLRLGKPSVPSSCISFGQSWVSVADMASQGCTEAILHPTETDSPFDFFGLPKELRLQILAYTHLGADGAFDPLHKDIRVGNDYSWQESPRNVFWRQRCYFCEHTNDDCTCCRFNSYASASFSHVSRLIPFELFSVNTLMKIESEEIFFSTNCFEFNQSPELTLKSLSPMNPRALKLLRQVRFTFRERDIQSWRGWKRYLGVEHSSWNRGFNIVQWKSLIAFMKENLEIPKLCLMIKTIRDTKDRLRRDREYEHREAYNAHCEIVWELTALQGLRDLHLDFPWFPVLEVPFERSVMGQDYNSQKGNRYSKKVQEGRNEDLPTWWISAPNQYIPVLE
ncbi:hypothetical protein MMC10_001582 [Thelotrema lepadinum]|nr:hypothetical protein [Thelotrema lepadinum]